MLHQFLSRWHKKKAHATRKRKTRHAHRGSASSAAFAASLLDEHHELSVPEPPSIGERDNEIPLVNEEGAHHEIERRESSVTRDQL
ncbi:hypothetical protein HYZ99_05280 [Candidatus Peregrinibacteria bacterium]|nr:hypothetical protein [Candidatus Peregrinibacteria bacterium]